MNIMKGGTGGCKHQEMTQALQCPTCQMKMVRAQSEFNRLRREYPEKFIRKEPEAKFDIETQNLFQKEEDRRQSDKLYYDHLKTLAVGRPEEKIREIQRMGSGFYEKHTGDSRRKIL